MMRGAENRAACIRTAIRPLPGYGRPRSIPAFIRVLAFAGAIALPAVAAKADSGVPGEGRPRSSEAYENNRTMSLVASTQVRVSTGAVPASFPREGPGAAPAVIRIGPDTNALATISVGQEDEGLVVDHASITIGPVQPMIGSISVGDGAALYSGGVVTVSRAADGAGLPAYIVPAVGNSSPPAGLPVSLAVLTSRYGFRDHPTLGGRRFHSGVDLAAPIGAPIAATSDGVVSTAGWHGAYGLLVVLDNGKGLQTRYGHMSRVNVVAGQHVKRGQVIGFVGSSGRSTGPHVHYELRLNGRAVDPLAGNSSVLSRR